MLVVPTCSLPIQHASCAHLLLLLLQQNLGAMLRSAHLLGVAGVLACSRNCAPLSPVVSKASAGAAELMKLHSCRSMPRTLADAAAKGWAVVGAAADDGAVPLTELRVDRPTVLVMGENFAADTHQSSLPARMLPLKKPSTLNTQHYKQPWPP